MSKPFKLIGVPSDGSVTPHRSNPSSLIYIQTLVDNVNTKTMIDTGSTISAINAAFMKQLNTNFHIYPTKISCKTADNSQLYISGMIVLPIRINNVQLTVNTFIIEDLCTSLLLGADFCTTYQVNINYGNKHLSLKITNQQTIVKFQQHPNDSQVFIVKTMNNIMIPPLSAMVIKATTSAPPMPALFTPSSQQLNKHGTIVPHAILMIDINHTTMLSVLNTTTTMQTIPGGTHLGKVKYHEDNNSSYVCPESHDQSQQYIAGIANNNLKRQISTSHSSIINTINTLSSHLSSNQQKQIRPVLLKHKDVFDLSKPSIIRTNNVYHRIPIQPHQQPIQSFPYRRPAKETAIINEQVKKMLANRIIRPSSSPWSSPVVIVKKKDGNPRFCVDYRRLNSITERDVYPLPRIDDIIDKLAGSQYFTTLDLKAGYWQIPIDEEDKKKTAFVTTDGLYEFNVLPFGLSNAPASFQRIINSVLGALRWDISLVYLDDIILYSKSFVQHIQHLELVPDALQLANVKLNPTKCTLARKQLDYLGFRITQDGIKPTTTNVKKTIDFPTPMSAKAAYSFVQMAQFYRRFIKDFASIAAPLNVFKAKNATFIWTQECQKSFDTLKQKLSQYPLLAFYDGKSKLKLKINTDASNTGIGGVLHQMSLNGHPQPIQYLSRSLSKREQKYSVIEKECLAMVWCITKLRPYLYGREFTLITDHHPLCWLNKQSSKNGRLDRWSLQLQEYSFDIKHTSGSSNCVANCLSRYPIQQPDDIVEEQLELMHGPSHIVNTVGTTSFDSTLIRNEQYNDIIIKRIYENLSNGKQHSSYVLEDGLVCKIVYRTGRHILKLPYIPASMINQLLQAYHDSPTSGHLGINKTWNKIRDRYFWPEMFKRIKEYVLSCTKCKQFKIDRTKSKGKLQPIEPPTGILDLMGLDFVGPVPQSTNGNKYILMCTDYLSRYAITQATTNCTSETAARFIVDKLILQFGVPRQLVTDRGTHFMSNVFEAITSRCGINHITTTTYHPQCNGLTERFNATLVDSIATYVNQQQSDWDDYLPYITFAYNTSRQSTIQMEPFKLMYVWS